MNNDNKGLLTQIQELTTLADYRFKAIHFAQAKMQAAKIENIPANIGRWALEIKKQENALEMINASIELIQSKLTTGVIDMVSKPSMPVQLTLPMASTKPVVQPTTAITDVVIKETTTKLKAEVVATPVEQREIKKEWGTEDSMKRSVFTMYKTFGKEKALKKAEIFFPEMFANTLQDDVKAENLENLIDEGRKIHEIAIKSELTDLYKAAEESKEKAYEMAKKIFSENWEKFQENATIAATKMNKEGEELALYVADVSDRQFTRFFNSQLTTGEKMHIDALREEVRAEKSPKRNLKIKTVDEISKISYWKDGKFNHVVFDSEKNTEDLVKATAIQLHVIGQTDTAIGILKEYYSEIGWDAIKARHFLFELMKEGEPYAELHTTVATYILEAMEQSAAVKDKNKADRVLSKGIEKGFNFVKAYFRTEAKDDKGQWIYAIDEKRMLKHMETAKAQAEAEYREMHRN